MNPNINTSESSGEKRLPEVSAQNVSHNFTTIQNIQGLQNIVQTGVPTIQSTQNAVSTISSPSTIVGKSISLDLNPKLSLMKSVVQTGGVSTGDASKLTTTLCPVGPTVRIISPGMLSAVERQPQQAGQSQGHAAQQVVTTIPATYHVPRGPAAVANISAPRSTVATPIVRASSGQTVVPISRMGVTTTVSNAAWSAKPSVVYAQPQRHPVPPVTRVTTRPPSTVYPSQQPRLVAPTVTRPVQATVVASVPTSGTAPRLLAPVLQPNNAITRIPVVTSRPPGTVVVTAVPATQTIRHQAQTVSTSQQIVRTATGTPNRVTVAASAVGTASRITPATSVTVQPAIGRQLTINPAPGAPVGTFNRVVIPAQQVQQSQSHQTAAPRVVQTIPSLANIGPVSRVITTTNQSNVTRVTQPPATSVARITGMTLHSLPITTARAGPPAVKPTALPAIPASQIKPAVPPQPLRVAPASVISTTTTTATTTASSVSAGTPVSTATIIISNNNSSNNSPTPAAAQSPLFTQYRQAPVQPVRLVVDPALEEAHGKPNASPRPSILRKRDYDMSPVKGAVKNLVPILTSMASTTATPLPSPPSPRNDGDGADSRNSGSTTVSATSSPGLDEEPDQTRIPMNHTMEMSPRKKPRKQQLTGVEFSESRCPEEEIQFITEDKMRRDREDVKNALCLDSKADTDLNSEIPVVMRNKPTPSMIGSAWKTRWGSRLNHYRRPSDVRPKEERRPTIAEIAQQAHVLQKIHGWKVYQLTAQMEDLGDLEKQVHDKLKTTLGMLESQQSKNRQDDGIERANELIKGNMQRSNLICEGMIEAKAQLIEIFQHKTHVTDLLQRCGNKRAQKKREKQ